MHKKWYQHVQPHRDAANTDTTRDNYYKNKL